MSSRDCTLHSPPLDNLILFDTNLALLCVTSCGGAMWLFFLAFVCSFLQPVGPGTLIATFVGPLLLLSSASCLLALTHFALYCCFHVSYWHETVQPRVAVPCFLFGTPIWIVLITGPARRLVFRTTQMGSGVCFVEIWAPAMPGSAKSLKQVLCKPSVGYIW